MVNIVDISDCIPLNLEEAQRGNANFSRVRLTAGGAYVPNKESLWSTEHLPQIEMYHVAGKGSVTPEQYIYFINNGRIGGIGATLKREDDYIFGSSAYPVYIKKYMEDGLRPLSWHYEIKNERTIPGLVFHIMHFNPMYGHWLLEIFPKLFAIRRLNNLGFSAPLLLPTSASRYVVDTIQMVLPNQEVIFYDPSVESVKIEYAVIPPMLHLDYVFDEEWVAEMQEFVATICGSSLDGTAIYITRSHIENKFRYLTNAVVLEDVARDLGFKIVKPETLPWIEQIKTYALADVIVGEYGSGMHNAVFSRPETKVVCFNILGKIQSRIANSFSQSVGYILDPDGRPREFTQGWKEQQTYSVDTDEFTEKMTDVLEKKAKLK